MKRFLEEVYWGNDVKSYCITAAIMLVVLLVYWLIKKKVITKLTQLANRTAFQYDEVIVSTVDKYVLPFVFLLIQYSIVTQLILSPRLDRVLTIAMAFVTTFYLVRLINHALQLSVKIYMQVKGEPVERIKQLNGILMVVKATVWGLGLLMLIDNLGYDITTIIAGLGVGGIAIALAAQNILGDLFSYFVIFFDKPFEVGDAILVNGRMGVVERIGIKTSHLRSFDGEQLVMPNAELVKTTIQNFKRLKSRRVLCSIGVTYDTSPQNLEAIPAIAEQIVKDVENTEFQRCNLISFGDFSLNYELAFNVSSDDYSLFLNIRQQVMVNLINAFNNRGIQFAFPTQTLYVQKTNV